MSIAGQVFKHAFGSAEGRLDVNHPIDGSGLLTQGAECIRLGQRSEFAGEMKSAGAKRSLEVSQERFPKPVTEDEIGKEEGALSTRDPA
jgi:hypothetical protein